MILKIVTTHVGIVIDKLLESIEYETKDTTQTQLIRFCENICGAREQQCLAFAIESYLADCLNFERACALSFEEGKLYALKYSMNKFGGVYLKNAVELPTALGLTGKCISEKRIITSNYGLSDPNYNAQIDNVLRVTPYKNAMMIPLFVDYNQGKILLKEESKDGKELVGVLQLINYKLGDVRKCNHVKFKNIIEIYKLNFSNYRKMPK